MSFSRFTPTASMLPALLASTMILGAPAIAVAGPPPPPGQTPFDEVRLPNGGFVRGDVGELVPGRFVVLITRSGEPRRFEWSEISSLVLADGTILDQSTTPGAMPEAVPQPGVGPQPGPADPGVVQPQPEPEPAAFDPDALPTPAPEPEPVAELATEPQSKTKPLVLITPNRDGPTLSLRRVTTRGGGAVGSKLPDNVGSEVVCEGACNVLVDRPTDEFFIASDGKPIARGFQLGTTNSSYELKVRRHSPVKLWSGVALIPAALLVGIGIGIIPALHNVPNEKIAAYAVGGTLISLAGIGGGVTLILFSFDKVKVLPGATAK